MAHALSDYLQKQGVKVVEVSLSRVAEGHPVRQGRGPLFVCENSLPDEDLELWGRYVAQELAAAP
jgi:hypothetical protein